MQEQVGHLVADRYRLLEVVAQDGMGRVWRGHDQLIDRQVAVRQVYLPTGLAPDQQHHMVEVVRRETRLVTQLRHPNIVAIFDAVQDGGMPWIIMEYVSGPSLDAFITRDGPMAWDKVAGIGADLAEALAYAHAAGLVHGGLEPSNVLLAGDRPMMTDFGVSRLLDVLHEMADPGWVIGNVTHPSPERIQGQPAQAPADLWGLGQILYLALEARWPFEAETEITTVLAIIHAPTPPAQRAGPLGPILEDLMAKAPENRPDAPAAAARLAALRGH